MKKYCKLIYRLLQIISCYILRNQRTINNETVKKNRVNLEWFHKNKIMNIGDTLGPVIVEWMLQSQNIKMNKSIKRTQRLFTVGSISSTGYADATIWGSGFHILNKLHTITLMQGIRKLDIRAVRGPLSRHIYKQLGYECPEVYGDPAILMPYIYQSITEKKYEVSVILHMESQELSINSEYNFINILTSDYKYFIDEICASKKIISSSLHGIILAEAYKIPCVFLNTGEYVDRALLKYYDWYYSTGRMDVKMCYSIEEALKVKPMVLPYLDQMQKQLMDVFPYDLWEMEEV